MTQQADLLAIVVTVVFFFYLTCRSCKPHRSKSNQKIVYFFLSICLFTLHIKCFWWCLYWIKYGRLERPKVTSRNHHQNKYKINNPKGKKSFTKWLVFKWPCKRILLGRLLLLFLYSLCLIYVANPTYQILIEVLYIPR